MMQSRSNYIIHYGVGHDKGGHSGRYPWGSGKTRRIVKRLDKKIDKNVSKAAKYHNLGSNKTGDEKMAKANAYNIKRAEITGEKQYDLNKRLAESRKNENEKYNKRANTIYSLSGNNLLGNSSVLALNRYNDLNIAFDYLKKKRDKRLRNIDSSTIFRGSEFIKKFTLQQKRYYTEASNISKDKFRQTEKILSDKGIKLKTKPSRRIVGVYRSPQMTRYVSWKGDKYVKDKTT